MFHGTKCHLPQKLMGWWDELLCQVLVREEPRWDPLSLLFFQKLTDESSQGFAE